MELKPHHKKALKLGPAGDYEHYHEAAGIKAGLNEYGPNGKIQRTAEGEKRYKETAKALKEHEKSEWGK